MSHVANNIDVDLHQTLDCVVAEELRSMGINEETLPIYRNHRIMQSMLKHSDGVFDRVKVPTLLFYQDSEEASHLYAFLEEVWKSKSFHEIGNLEMLWSAEFKARKQSSMPGSDVLGTSKSQFDAKWHSYRDNDGGEHSGPAQQEKQRSKKRRKRNRS